MCTMATANMAFGGQLTLLEAGFVSTAGITTVLLY